ncbi:class I SAM-dependent methyltransferase [Micromonospora sp. NBC_01699]|uniref:class I SAM-dependent methyltransferase n=1 Tax=Micromonospora sp. NBC_01699 TaxID=2975984 RepID=UPI002E317BD1|nr:class I SAM-dependent methyltransferase [Micromonospora sp. NBC_01699]
MPTTSPSAAPDGADLPPYRHRGVAESFGVDPGRYDRTRPDYPDDLIRRIAASSPGSEVLDVGCGTGIASRQLQAAGCAVVGVEPDPRMATWARQRGLAVEMATFESWDPAGRTFDAVVAGQTWHWVDPVAGAAKAAEALRPGGRFAAFWNVDQPPADLAEAFAEVYRRVLPDSPMTGRMRAVGPDAYDPLCATAADGIRQTGAFGEPERWRDDWQRTYTREAWLDLLPTQGLHTNLPAATLDRLLVGVGAAIDAVGGSFPMRYTTVTVTATRS